MAGSLPPSDGLYNGPDLAKAATLSPAHLPALGLATGIGNALTILLDVLRHRLARRTDDRFEVVTASGRAGADSRLFAAYAGTGANRTWCLSSAFPDDGYDIGDVATFDSESAALERLGSLSDRTNFVFLDGIGRRDVGLPDFRFIAVPAWIKQRLRIAPEWQTQLAEMRRNTRQEVARVLRKHAYESRLVCTEAAFTDFHDRLYVPYMTQRFREGAVLVPRERFLNECRRGAVLQLSYQGSIIGAALLRRTADTLAIVWSAPDVHREFDGLKGISDALDYFSLLCAHRAGCRWLDFGPSRPDLRDGTLRYKRRWGTELTAGRVSQATIRWACAGRHPAEGAFLTRHAFISRRGSTLQATAFVDSSVTAEQIERLIQTLVTPGIDSCRIVAITPLSDDASATARDHVPRISLIETTSIAEALAAAAE